MNQGTSGGIDRRRARIGRGLGGASVLAILVVVGLLVSGALIALAVTTAIPVPPGGYATGGWIPSSLDPSGAAWIPSGEYLMVVDTNVNNSSGNAWKFDIHTGVATNRASGVAEPSGIDYDLDTNTLFVTQDDGHIFVFTDFDTPAQQMIPLDVSIDSFDTEDPAYNRDNDRLYWVDGDEDALFELNPVNGWAGTDPHANTTRFDLDLLSQDADWEGLAWDPRTGNLLIGNGNTNNELIYETDITGDLINTVDATGVPNLTKISGLGVAPASFDSTKQSLWITDRNSHAIFEVTFDGTVPPPTSSTSTTQPTSTTSGGSSSTSSSTSSTSTTSTTVGGSSTTTTTIPGGTTTTTQPQTPPEDPDLVFSDIAGSVFAKSIQWLAAEGITQGCNPPANTMFCPDGRVTRGQMAAFLVRAQTLPAYNGPDRFVDDDNSVFEGAIERLAQAGITVGCNPPLNDRFCADRNVTRGEMAAFLGRAFGYTDNGGGDWFVDDDSSVFENAIDRLRTAAITQGCNPPRNDRYCPDQFVTRGQMAAFLKRALEG